MALVELFNGSKIVKREGKDHIVLTVTILWQIWEARNQFHFSKERRGPKQIINKAMLE